MEIHEYERIEGLQAEENTFSERKLKAEETPVENHTQKKIREADSRRLGVLLRGSRINGVGVNCTGRTSFRVVAAIESF